MIETTNHRLRMLRMLVPAGLPAVLFLAIAGCSSKYADRDTYSGPAVFTEVTLSPRAVTAGEETILRVVVHNRARDDLALDYKGFYVFGYRLRDAADGRILAWFPWQNKVQAQRLVIAAGDSATQEFRLPTRRQAEGWNLEGNLLPAGSYRIEAGLAEYADDYPWASAVLEVRPPGF